MGKTLKTWNERKLLEKLDNNRGIGEFEYYKPFLKTQDFSSKGISHRVKGNLINRMYEFFSNIQYNTFLLLEDQALDRKSKIIDIREHYPLWEMYDLDIIDESFKHIKFRDQGSNLNYVFTSTLMLTISTQSETKHEVITVKNGSDLKRLTTLERLELERRYWTKYGIDWSLITNKEIEKHKVRIKNIKFYRNSYYLSDFGNDMELSDEGLRSSLKHCIINSNETITETIKKFGVKNKIDQELCLLIFKNLLARKDLFIQDGFDINLNLSCKYVMGDLYDNE